MYFVIESTQVVSGAWIMATTQMQTSNCIFRNTNEFNIQNGIRTAQLEYSTDKSNFGQRYV